jgi:hypothetical protein
VPLFHSCLFHSCLGLRLPLLLPGEALPSCLLIPSARLPASLAPCWVQ